MDKGSKPAYTNLIRKMVQQPLTRKPGHYARAHFQLPPFTATEK